MTKLKEEEKFVPVVKKTGIMIVCPFVCKKEMDQNELDDHECSVSEAGEDKMQLGDFPSEDDLVGNTSSATPSSRNTPEENGLDGLWILHEDSSSDKGILKQNVISNPKILVLHIFISQSHLSPSTVSMKKLIFYLTAHQN